MSAWESLFCSRCGKSGHPQRPSIVSGLPLLVHGKRLVTPEPDPARAMAIRDRIEAEAAARKAARARQLSDELAGRYTAATD